MKQLLTLIIGISLLTTANAQAPVKWVCSAKKIALNTFEIHITAAIQPGWHLYAQEQPQDAIALPTAIRFENNPVVELNGKPKEQGSLKKQHDPSLGISSYQYTDKVDFVQEVKLKYNIKTNVSGSVEFQICTDEKCLPPATVGFNLSLN